MKETKEINLQLAESLASLGYPGFAYLRQMDRKTTPPEALLIAIVQDDLEARVVEALPWVILEYWELDFTPLIEEAKLSGRQNRLGFLVSIARQISQRSTFHRRTTALEGIEHTIERIKLPNQDVLMRRPRNEFELRWLAEHSSEEAKKWNLITGLRCEDIKYTTTDFRID